MAIAVVAIVPSATGASAATGTWTSQTVPSTAGELHDVSCPTVSDCYTVGGNGESPGNTVIATTDGGTRWTTQTLPSTAGYLDGIACPSPSTCYAVAPGTLVTTTDGGSMWDNITSSPTFPSMNSIVCPSTSTCYGVGGDTIFFTTDSWTTWTSQTEDVAGGDLDGIACPSLSDCYAVGDGGGDSETPVPSSFIFATTDGGTTWTSQTLPTGAPTTWSPTGVATLYDISCPSTTVCYSVGWNGGSSGLTLGTTDGGATWAILSESTATDSVESISCPSTSDCYSTGLNNIFATTDGGSTWINQSLPQSPNDDTQSIACPSLSTCYSVGGNATAGWILTGPGEATIPSVSVSPSTVNPGQLVTYSATVAPASGSGTPTGTVLFAIGTDTLCGGPVSLVAGTASCSDGSAPLGADTVTATYEGDASFAGSQGSAVLTVSDEELATVTITPAANPATSGPVVYSVTVTGGGPTPTGTVDLSDGQGEGCWVTLISGAAGCAITESATDSPYQVTAVYSGDNYYATATSGMEETVTAAPSQTAITPSSNPANEGPVTYTVLVTGGGADPTGSALISDGQDGTCVAALTQGVGNCAIDESDLISPFTISATYSGDVNYAGSSASLTNARGVSSSPTGAADATLGTTTATAIGVGTVNLLQYQADPVGAPTYVSTGVYLDDAASSGNTFGSEVLTDCDLNGGTSLMWWNPAANSGAGGWLPVVGDPGPTFTPGPPACATATLDATTSPTIDQLSGTVLGAAKQASAPTVSEVVPASGSTSGGTQVAIIGTGFSAAPGATSFAFGPGPSTNVSCTSASVCTVDTPVGTTGPVTITSTVGGQTSSGGPTFTYVQSGAAPLQVTTSSLPEAIVHEKYAVALTATGGNAPYAWKLATGSARLPVGLKLDKATGKISGTPQSSGTFTFTVEVLDTKAKTKPHTQSTTTRTLSLSIS